MKLQISNAMLGFKQAKHRLFSSKEGAADKNTNIGRLDHIEASSFFANQFGIS
ncbi:hypothetical protein [Xanthomonas sp. LMG 12462]|uniref:hypothetical protein n=1 Tax=Xanthomonas sp. LMG 12462 TaxID=1591134 RepID=UPI00186AF15A|nr:hypothetical protein [Xanthomonas sp. LMG 12462]